MPVTVPNPYGFNDPALGQSMTNIAQMLFGAGASGPNAVAKRNADLAATNAQTLLYGTQANDAAYKTHQLETIDNAKKEFSDYLGLNPNMNMADPATKAKLAQMGIMAGEDLKKVLGPAMYLFAGPENERDARFTAPFVTGSAMGKDQAATMGGAEKIRTAGYEHEMDKQRLASRGALDVANVKATTEKTPLDITPAEAQAFRREMEASLGLFYDKDGVLTSDSGAPVDINALNTLVNTGLADYQKTRNAGTSIQNAIAAHPLRETGEPGVERWLFPDTPSTLKRVLAGPGGAAPGAQPSVTNAVAVPPPAQRVAGQTYSTPRGPMRWTGTGWLPAQ